MYYVFNRSCVGYSHLKNGKPCQDFSASYQDNERVIITCCDGHGGVQYVRSQIGSKLASEAVMNVFKGIDYHFFYGTLKDNLAEKIKLLILCEYNKLIERETASNPIRKREFEGLSEEQIDTLRFNPAKAYGTTLSGAMVYRGKLIVVSIGDTEALGVRKGEMVKLFDNSNDPVANVTYSMSQEDAYKYLRVTVLEMKSLDGVILCTDGLSSPYQSYENFNKNFLRPMVKGIITSKSTSQVEQHVEDLADHLGVGDDVSLSFIFNKQTSSRYYR